MAKSLGDRAEALHSLQVFSAWTGASLPPHPSRALVQFSASTFTSARFTFAKVVLSPILH